jgi:hypothetical protein
VGVTAFSNHLGGVCILLGFYGVVFKFFFVFKGLKQRDVCWKGIFVHLEKYSTVSGCRLLKCKLI